MNRRKFLKVSAFSSATLVVGGSATWWAIPKANGVFSIQSLLNRLDHFDVTKVQVIGEWDLAKIVIHCAQSVEYSYQGYPQHKSDIFKQTIGRLAFSMFEAKRKMTHDLTQAIPGAPEIAANQDLDQALKRLRLSLLEFDHFKGSLAPHFAYGKLTKQQYAVAHVMHFNDHCSEVINQSPV